MDSKDNAAIEVCWHGRGGQGAKSASAVLAEVLCLRGKYVQAFPEYGAERQGAPMRAYNRISNKPIRCRCGVRNPHIVIVTDPTLLGRVNLGENRREDMVYVVNSPAAAAELRGKLGALGECRLLAVDATKITLEELGQNRPNAPLLGALSRVFDDVPAEVFADCFTSKMKQLPPLLLEANRRAILRGREEACWYE